MSGEFGFTYLKLGIIDFTELIFFYTFEISWPIWNVTSYVLRSCSNIWFWLGAWKVWTVRVLCNYNSIITEKLQKYILILHLWVNLDVTEPICDNFWFVHQCIVFVYGLSQPANNVLTLFEYWCIDDNILEWTYSSVAWVKEQLGCSWVNTRDVIFVRLAAGWRRKHLVLQSIDHRNWWRVSPKECCRSSLRNIEICRSSSCWDRPDWMARADSLWAPGASPSSFLPAVPVLTMSRSREEIDLGISTGGSPL